MAMGDHEYKRVCQACEESFVAHHPASKYCSDRCRKRKVRAEKKAATAGPTSTVGEATEQPGGPGGTYAKVLAALTAAGRADTWLGSVALNLAMRVDTTTAAMGYAPMVKELRTTMEAALAGAEVKVADPLDELRAKRDHKRAAAR